MATELEKILFASGIPLARIRPAETSASIAARLEARAEAREEREIGLVLYRSTYTCTKCGAIETGSSGPMLRLRRADGAERFIPVVVTDLHEMLPREIRETSGMISACQACFLGTESPAVGRFPAEPSVDRSNEVPGFVTE